MNTEREILRVSNTERRRLLMAAAFLPGFIGSTLIGYSAAVAAPPDLGSQRSFLRLLGDLLIPSTDTPGAGTNEVAEFVLLGIAHGLVGATPDLLAQLSSQLAGHADQPFLQMSAEQRQARLEAVDRATFLKPMPVASPWQAVTMRHSPWAAVKALILMGYYRSEAGGSEELQYLFVPGALDADVVADNGGRAFSSDWTGVNDL